MNPIYITFGCTLVTCNQIHLSLVNISPTYIERMGDEPFVQC